MVASLARRMREMKNNFVLTYDYGNVIVEAA
jgi:hypothetical protein